MKETPFLRASALAGSDEPFAVVVIAAKRGSAARTHGRMVVTADGTIAGTIGGGELEAYAVRQAVGILEGETGRKLYRYSVAGPGGTAAGTVTFCIDAVAGGEDRELFERAAKAEEEHRRFVYAVRIDGTGRPRAYADDGICLSDDTARPLVRKALENHMPGLRTAGGSRFAVDLPETGYTLILLGGGHVHQAIARLAHETGFAVRVAETRSMYAGADLFPSALSRTVAPTMKEALDRIPIDGKTAVLLSSPSVGRPLLERLLASDAFYLGILGSHLKAKAILSLGTAGFDRRLHCPVGLDIGSETPAEIAVSVMAEIMKEKNGTAATSMSVTGTPFIIVKGAGDLATGVIIRLVRAGYRVVCLEAAKPTVIRRTVSLAQAMFDGTTTVEDITGVRCRTIEEAGTVLGDGGVPVIADSEGSLVRMLKPAVVVDAILAKRNLGTTIVDAPLVIALGPGFTAGKDCHAAIETKRGHSLGRIITDGSPAKDSGIPGIIAGYGIERVVRSPAAGIFRSSRAIGDIVEKGETIATVGETAVTAAIGGMLRGLLYNGLSVTPGFKIADIDPRGPEAQYTTVSDKAKAIAGGVLEVVDEFFRTGRPPGQRTFSRRSPRAATYPTTENPVRET